MDVLLVYRLNIMVGTTLQPHWYHDKFVEWAEEITNLVVLPDLMKHSSLLHRNWCSLLGCPYPYVTEQIIVLSAAVPGQQVLKECMFPAHVYNRMMYLRWGVL